MIKASELRIGNWIQWKEGQYEQITESGMMVLLGTYPPINPIPLTPELLEKCGFKNEYGQVCVLQIGKSYEKGTMVFTYYYNSDRFVFSVGEGGEEMNWVSLPTPKYLHQLQNLYFSLTGGELQVSV